MTEQEQQEAEILSTCKRDYQRSDAIMNRLSKRWPMITRHEIDTMLVKLVNEGKLTRKGGKAFGKYMRA